MRRQRNELMLLRGGVGAGFWVALGGVAKVKEKQGGKQLSFPRGTTPPPVYSVICIGCRELASTVFQFLTSSVTPKRRLYNKFRWLLPFVPSFFLYFLTAPSHLRWLIFYAAW